MRSALLFIFIVLGNCRNSLWLNAFPNSPFGRSKQAVSRCKTARIVMPDGSFCRGMVMQWQCGAPFVNIVQGNCRLYFGQTVL